MLTKPPCAVGRRMIASRCAQAAAGQDALDKKVHMLEAHQAEIHASLASMEGEAARLYQVRPPSHTLCPHPHTLQLPSHSTDACSPLARAALHGI